MPLSAILKGCVEALTPSRCLGCPELVDRQGTLCSNCWSRITFITEPQCKICGYPFEHAISDEAICAGCLHTPPPYAQARSLMAYEETSRKIILELKHGDGTHIAPYMAQWLARLLPEKPDLITPVPLHWVRLLKRGYNQSALISNALSRLLGLPLTPDLLVRSRNTPSQGGLTNKKRHQNVSTAFTVQQKNLTSLKNKNIVLIDDVFTTGATVVACSKALKRAGARCVTVLTVARVVFPHKI